MDAETGVPLDAFNVMLGELDPEWAYPLAFGTAGKEGKFSLSLPAKSTHPAYQVQIEKEGYLPAVSANLSKKGGNQTFEFKLQRGSGPSGVVLLPGGEPAVNAAVLLCTSRTGVTIDGPAHVARGLNTTTYRAQTDDAGRFTLPAAVAPQGLIVIHDQGYAELSLAAFEASGSITLQPWGRVEGSLVLDSQPAANERIVAGNLAQHAGRTRADDDHVVVVISAALRRPARAPCTRRTSPASSGRLAPSAPRAARAQPRRAASPATGRPPTRTSCRRRHAQATAS